MLKNKSSRDQATNVILAKRWTPVIQTILLHVLLMVFLMLRVTDERLVSLAELLKALMIIGLIAAVFFLSFTKNSAEERRRALVTYAMTLGALLAVSFVIHLLFLRGSVYDQVFGKVLELYKFAIPMAIVLSGLWAGQRYFRRRAGTPASNKNKDRV